MQKRMNKKGFTIVELVIVIAVVAVLAAVLIPTFVGLVRKANIANDTAVAKNLNTAAISAEADTFEEALAAIKDAGYLVANLNAKAEDCYFVWEDDTNQFLLYDFKEDKVLYSNTDDYGDIDASWCFAINNSEDQAQIRDQFPDVTIKLMLGDALNIADILEVGGTVYVDESLILDEENLLVFDDASATTKLMLGNSSLNTSGILSDAIPIQINKGSVEIYGGTIGASGSFIDDDGELVNTPIQTMEGTTTVIDGTTFNIADNGFAYFDGNATIKNTTFNSQGTTIYSGANGNVVLENVTAISTERCVWASNWNGVDHSSGTSTLTIKSGTYKGGSASFSAITAYSGDIIIEGGNFTSNEGIDHLFYVMHANGTITIKGGTFNGVAFADLDESDVLDLCFNANHKVTKNADGSFTIVKK